MKRKSAHRNIIQALKVVILELILQMLYLFALDIHAYLIFGMCTQHIKSTNRQPKLARMGHLAYALTKRNKLLSPNLPKHQLVTY